MKVLRVVFSASLWLGMALLLAGGGCDDPVDLCDPRPVSGNIHGRVLSGGLPVEVQIIAEKIVDDWNQEAQFLVEPDDQGFFSMDVGPENYFFEMRFSGTGDRYQYTESGLAWGNVPRDTLVIRANDPPKEINFDLAGVTLDMKFPMDFNGWWVDVLLHSADDPEDPDGLTRVDRRGGYVKFGHLHVELAGVLPGRYQAAVLMGSDYPWSDLYDHEHFWVPGTRDRNESPWYEVGVNSLVVLECRLPTDPARIEGVVGGSWLDMGLGTWPRVTVVTQDSIPLFRGKRVDPEGAFAFDLLLPEPVKLAVHQGDIVQWIGGPGFEEATVFNLQPGDTLTGVEYLQSGIHFFVDAPAEATGEGLVDVFDASDMELVASTSHRFPDRHLAIANLWPGDYLVRIQPREWEFGEVRWMGQWFDGVQESDQAQVVSITEHGETVSLDLAVEIGGGIIGTVESETGNLFVYYIVMTPADEKTALGGMARSMWLSWKYEYWGLPDGDYKIGFMPLESHEVDPISEEAIWYPGTTDWTNAGVLEIRDAGVVEGVDIVVPWSNGDN